MKKTKFILFIASVLLSLTLSAAPQRQLMISKLDEPGVSESFKPCSRFLPYPAYSDRNAWKKFADPGFASDIIKEGEKYLGWKWRHVCARAFMETKKTGNHDLKHIETNNRAALVKLAMAEAVEGKGRFLKDLADGFWFYSTSYHWTLVSSTGSDILPSFDQEKVGLGSGRTAQSLSVIWYVFGEEFDKIDPMIGKTFKESAKRLILDPFLDSANDKAHWWLGKPHNRRLNNHAPWNICSVLTCFLVIEPDKARLDSAIRKGLETIDIYLNDFPADGLCDEGPVYWFNSVGRYCALLQLLKDASAGRFDVMPDPFITSLGTYISRCCAGITPKGDEIIANYGDSHSRITMDAFVLWRTGKILGSPELCDLALYSLWNGKTFKRPKQEKSEAYRAFENLRSSRDLAYGIKELNGRKEDGAKVEDILAGLRAKVPAVTYFPDGGQVFIRTKGDWFFSGKAAWNGEAHNHNDAGSCILYVGGTPVIIDPGVGTYTDKTFGPHRYELWTMVSPWHNVPLINGVPQHHGNKYKTSNPKLQEVKDGYEFSMDIQGAYLQECSCDRWTRTYKIGNKGGGTLEITDNFELSSRTAPDTEYFMIQGTVKQVAPGVLHIVNEGKTFEMKYPQQVLSFSIDIQDDLDSHLKKEWGDQLTRINLSSRSDAPLKGTYVIKLKEIK